MSLTLDELRRLYARCDPNEPLKPGDPRYVDVDHVDDAGSRPRRYAWAQRIARKFELGFDTPRMVLLTGLPGSGKSTELRRILAKLREPEGAALFPVLIDAEEAMDLHAPLERTELILTLLVEVERCIMIELEGIDPAKVNDAIAQDSVVSRLWTWLSTTEVELSKFDIGAHGQKLTLELKSNMSFKERVRGTVKRQLGGFLLRARGHMAELEARVKRWHVDEPTTRYRGLIVALDSLEKLRGLSSNAQDVLASVEAVFSNLNAQDLGAHAIFTVPAALATRRNLDVEFIPVIKIHDRSGRSYAPGLQAMRSLLDLRMTADEQRAVFGPALDERVQTMIVRSGGYPREFMKMVQEALSVEELPLSVQAFRVLLGARADGYRRLVRTDALALLRKIHSDKPPLTLPVEDLGSYQMSDMLLMNSLVMLYQNDTEWTDVNPALLPMLEERGDVSGDD